MRMRVYIAGPITQGDREANVAAAVSAMRELIDLGFAPCCPALSCYIPWNEEIDHATWLAVDGPWVIQSEALLRLPGPSIGADWEVALAQYVGIPCYHKIADIEQTPRPHDLAIYGWFHKLLTMFSGKGHDYANRTDPYANLRSAESCGVEPFVHGVCMLNHKQNRLNNYCQNNSLKYEGVLDTLDDTALYAFLTRRLYEQRQESEIPGGVPPGPGGSRAGGRWGGRSVPPIPTGDSGAVHPVSVHLDASGAPRACRPVSILSTGSQHAVP